MSEQEIREGMLLAVWDEPPLDFDPDTLIRRVEQKKSRRRALVGVGVATAMIAVVSFALPGLLPRDRDSQLGSDAQTTSSAPSSESKEKRTERIGVRLAELLALKMPNANEVFASFPGEVNNSAPPSAPLSTQRKPSDEVDLNGFVNLTDSIGPTALRVIAGPMTTYQPDLCPGAIRCHTTNQSDGSTVTEAEYVEGANVTRAVALRQFKSGYTVQIQSLNYNPATTSGLRQTVPVRVGVLTELVTDPSIDWE